MIYLHDMPQGDYQISEPTAIIVTAMLCMTFIVCVFLLKGGD